ncbi:MAG: tRNA uridine-5-carboxymethylaminomethyl(34) synthesis GTPase MnmE [Ignavibacteriaceae bacterium]|jgi:tRNA modification GTPase|nr:tRNA uridine-5-carboxymethylaminomethyl(34) synthesis GTPase MnmE [Ignavibacteriaceae bacterium]MCW8812411.1 tRNA uridine-5-carboxymethylaminomethyl(34) synthesis GTPase MnmE [Chlorobium sp.]MCW8818634.1 tRNA uridine-5-carboxymethylaminomethyl(34) synthesis GTPase MnmE [Ignavibacteriaceae bacterium]MCW8824472.1 tRNA uridine-5-carboxymethylaminomethyl(34) synthesis GTPase MnmE [Ignavibacteriaceae bacterium]MCW8960489.1 tRNA uridine-5-carboxymethylaminomethyl(34) synthesis GTPase MnmE [Ignavib
MSIESKEDTIIALATPPGVGAISIIRLSGPKSFDAIDKVFSGGTKLKNAKSHTIHYGNIIENNEILDDVLVSIFKEPNSYTGEDSVEISSHGSPLIVEKIISLLINNSDIRAAEPGEFTKRAFLNNRIDLTQAEAVADLINSRTTTSFRGARNQLNGLLSSKVGELRKGIIDISSFLELELDFAEEEIELIKKEELVVRINDILSQINDLLSSYSFGKIIRDGMNVVIVGEPNVGKSSILNYLLKESRAIVSSIPGTTRDTIREEISIDGLFFKLYDTAGIRTSREEIEREGVERSRLAVKNADLILFVGDVDLGFSTVVENEMQILNPSAKVIKILNKIDLGVNSKFSEYFRISAKTGDGMMNFIEGLKKQAIGESAYSENDAIITNIRHYNCLIQAKQNLIKALKTVSKKISGEFIASDLRAVDFAFAEIIGEVTPEDILNNIFSKFCIGK